MRTLPSPATGPYGYRDLRKLYPRVTENHLRYLEKWGLLRQTAGPRENRVYSFADLLIIKQIAGELERGTPLKVILRALLAEREGQMELDFHGHTGPDTPRPKVVALQPRKAKRGVQDAGGASPLPAGTVSQGTSYSDPQSALAAKYFVEGSHLDDGSERNRHQAISAYRKALIIDPDLVPAIVNLANLHYGSDELIEAQALYERAINLDPDCFEAHFNLGNIQHDLGRYAGALVCYRDAVELNPTYADAHFYLAVTLEKIGHSQEAKAHWRSYQELAPDGEWSELAKEFLE